MNHAQRVGKVANLVIFLGILGIMLSIAALTFSQGLSHRGYGFRYIILGLLMIGLGYGMRYRYTYCHDAAIVLFLMLSGNFFLRLFAHYTSYLALRFLLCSWVSYRLILSASSLRELIATNTFPDTENRFMRFFWRKKNP